MNRYFISDTHFGHQNILLFERGEFASIKEHDDFVIEKMLTWAQKQEPGKSELWHLGDFGDIDKLAIFKEIRMQGVKCYFVYGNHDHSGDIDKFEAAFDKVYLYPTFLSNKLVVSHLPVAVYGDSINIHGHLHGAHLADLNHICVSLKNINYRPFSEKHLNKKWAMLPQFDRRFLYEPWAEDYIFDNPKPDAIYNKDGVIDLAASRVLQKISQTSLDTSNKR